jgi:hypothetical protein
MEGSVAIYHDGGDKNMTTIRIIAMSALLIAFMTTMSEAGWLIYHMPELNGQILDIETKQPIEGAVVVVEYKKSTMGLGAGRMSSSLDVREALTDKDGNFHIPSYTTIIQPFSWQAPSPMIIFKPGYASLGYLELGAGYFTGEKWKERDGSWPDPELRMLKYRLSGNGVVELPKLNTREQRLLASRISIDDYSAKELPLLYKALDEEKTLLGIKRR